MPNRDVGQEVTNRWNIPWTKCVSECELQRKSGDQASW